VSARVSSIIAATMAFNLSKGLPAFVRPSVGPRLRSATSFVQTVSRAEPPAVGVSLARR
jgi:hypothetical protein